MRRIAFRTLLLSMVALGANGAIAQQTDYTCMRNCQDAGYLYGFCQSQCSFDTGNDNNNLMGGSGGGILPDSRTKSSRTDYGCMSDCRDMGYQYGYCKQLCEY